MAGSLLVERPWLLSVMSAYALPCPDHQQGRPSAVGEHIVRVVDDDELAAEPGWAMAHDGETTLFIVRKSSAPSAQVLTDAWEAARQIENDEIEAAVRDGHSST